MDEHKGIAGGQSCSCGADSSGSAGHSESMGRRTFLGALLGMASAGMGMLCAVPVLRYVLYPVYAKSRENDWCDVGDAGEFSRGCDPVCKAINFTRRDGWREVVSAQSVYVRRGQDGQLKVLSAVCPHLGCSVAWRSDEKKFVCPCHGGQFQADGEHVSGPPPRSMDHLQTQVVDGKLQVQFVHFRPNVSIQEPMS